MRDPSPSALHPLFFAMLLLVGLYFTSLILYSVCACFTSLVKRFFTQQFFFGQFSSHRFSSKYLIFFPLFRLKTDYFLYCLTIDFLDVIPRRLDFALILLCVSLRMMLKGLCFIGCKFDGIKGFPPLIDGGGKEVIIIKGDTHMVFVQHH